MPTATLRPIRRVSSLVEEVCGRLSHLIRADLPDGDGWLPPERKLAEELGVSRPVVREATKRLELQGLLEIRHGIGTKVVDKLHKPLNGSLSLLIPDEMERLRQLNESRMVIEPQAARLAATRATPEQLAAMRATHDELLAAPDAQTAIVADMAFHRAVAEASGNLMFRLILDSLAEIGLTSRRRTIGSVGKGKAIEHHARVIRAIERHQPDAAERAMRHHIVAAGRDMGLEPEARQP